MAAMAGVPAAAAPKAPAPKKETAKAPAVPTTPVKKPAAPAGPVWAPKKYVEEAIEGALAGSDAPLPPSAGAATSENATDVPPYAAGPARFAVAPFENHSNVKALDWLIAGAPFEIAEKAENVLGLAAAGGPLAVPGAAVESDPVSVAAYARDTGATYVITGWVQRPNWELKLDAAVWKVTAGIAIVVGEAKRQGPIATYPQMLGEVMTDMWTKAGVPVDKASAERLARPLSKDLYPVELMGRGLGHLTGALAAGKVSLKDAEHDLERSAFIDPKMYEAQRLLGELYLAEAAAAAAPDPKLVAKAGGKFNYANDLAPNDIESLRAAAHGAVAGDKHDVARDLYKKLVTRQPWDLDARYQLGAALWATGDAHAAEVQLAQVTAVAPDLLPARRVLALIHASRSDTPRLIAELQAIAVRAPADLDVKADLASALGALGKWTEATAQLEAIASLRTPDLALLVRIGDGHRKAGELDAALQWYGRAQKLAPESSYPGFMAAQALFDAGKLAEAVRAYTLLQKFKDDVASAEEALGAIALAQGRNDDGAWYLRRAAREAPRSLVTRRGVIAAELARKDTESALAQLEPALAAWPDDAALHYLAAVAHGLAGERDAARAELVAALAVAKDYAEARGALGVLDAGGPIALAYRAEVVRPWGDAEALTAELDRFTLTATSMAAVRVSYQAHLLVMLGALGQGPAARLPLATPRSCPLAEVAPAWTAAQAELATYAHLGSSLEAAYRFVVRHDDTGATAALLPQARTAVSAAKKSYRVALADVSELRAEWTRSLGPELRRFGCTDRLLAAAVGDPKSYHVIQEDKPEAIPTHMAARAKPRVTFYVDNVGCPDPVDVAVDGTPVGQVGSHTRSAFLADGGERTLCLLGPNAAQCGDRGTNRTVYLHDGWSVTLKCTTESAKESAAPPPEPEREPDPGE